MSDELPPAADSIARLAERQAQTIERIRQHMPPDVATSMQEKLYGIANTIRKTRKLTAKQKSAVENIADAVDKYAENCGHEDEETEELNRGYGGDRYPDE